jgi:uncharacterized membrane-anchored protein
MAEVWKPQPREVIESWIEDIISEASDKLTPWETNFVESVSKQLDRTGSLSQKQEEILERIYAEKTR